MVVGYQVRCRRCGYPYYPENVQNRICVFCRRTPLDIPSRKERLEIMTNSIKHYSTTQNIFPVKEKVVRWITSKFDVNRTTANSYIKEMLDLNAIRVLNDGPYERIQALKI